jgi:hypothetical protein
MPENGQPVLTEKHFAGVRDEGRYAESAGCKGPFYVLRVQPLGFVMR